MSRYHKTQRTLEDSDKRRAKELLRLATESRTTYKESTTVPSSLLSPPLTAHRQPQPSTRRGLDRLEHDRIDDLAQTRNVRLLDRQACVKHALAHAARRVDLSIHPQSRQLTRDD